MQVSVDPDSKRVSEADLALALYEVSVRASNSTLEALYRSDLGQSITVARQDQNWWFRRLEYLVGKQLIMYERTGNDTWEGVYNQIATYGAKFTPKHSYDSLLLVRTLLDIGADPRDWGLLIYDVVRSGNVDVLKLLLQDERSAWLVDGALGEAIREENRDMIDILLDRNEVDPSRYNNDDFIVAVQTGDIEVVERLLADSRVNPAARENAAINICCKRGYADILDLLLDDDRVIDHYALDEHSNDRLYLDLAAEHSHSRVIEVLLDALNPSLDNVDIALITACRVARLDTCVALVECLLENDAQIPEKAFIAARTRRRADVLEMLERARQRSS